MNVFERGNPPAASRHPPLTRGALAGGGEPGDLGAAFLRGHPHPPPSGAPSPLKGEGLRAADSRPYREGEIFWDGRVRTPAPTKFGGIFRFCRRGRRPRRPAGAQCAPLQQGSPLRRHPNVPDRPTGGASPSPTVLKKLFRDWVGEALGPPAGICTGSVGSVKPGAPTGPHQPKFLQTQGPVARREFRPATQILRAGNVLSGPRGNPRNGGSRGWGSWRMRRSRIRLAPPPGAFLVTFWASKKSLAAGAAKLPLQL